MIQPRIQQQSNPDTRPKWFNSPVTFHEGTLSDIRRHIPDFERRSFSLPQSGNEMTRINDRLDTIVRKPFGQDQNFIPVGVVSKEYTFVPHANVLDVTAKALESVQVSPGDVKTELRITEYGERMALSLYLPDKFSFDPGDGHPLALRLECFNSVDGSTRFRALMGWFRFVCSNGLVIGVTRSDVRRRHVGDIRLSDVGAVLIAGIEESEKEKHNFEQWRKRVVKPTPLALWIEKELRKGWGFKAAARTYHIFRTGYDADVLGPYKDNTPITIPVRPTNRVPGTPKQSRNLYEVSQILAWLAKERRDVHEQLEWREQIPELLKPLMN
jgi:hypothetical protein